jgi:hypothetical protein
MEVWAMKRQGMSFKKIDDELGYHPATIAKWVKAGGPPPARTVADEGPVIDPVVGGPADGAAGREPEAVGDIVVRDHLSGGLHRVVKDSRE